MTGKWELWSIHKKILHFITLSLLLASYSSFVTNCENRMIRIISLAILALIIDLSPTAFVVDAYTKPDKYNEKDLSNIQFAQGG